MCLVTQLAPRNSVSLALLLAVFAPCARAQWNGDAAVNLLVASTSASSSYSSTASTADGGLWVVWSASANSTFDARVQRFDSAGYPVFGPTGLVALDIDVAYLDAVDCVVTASGDLVLCVQGTSTWLQRVGPGGALPWGTSGITTSLPMWSGRIEALGDDVVFVGTRAFTAVVSVQRYDRTGTEVWGAWISMPEFAWSWFDVATSATDVYVTGYLPLSGPWPVGVGLQRIDASGATPWGPRATLISGTAPVNGSNHPPAVHLASNNGAVVGYDVVLPLALQKLFMQRVDAQGAVQWGPYGLPVSPVTAVRKQWDVEYDDVSDEVVAVWSERELAFPTSPNPFTYRMQRFDALGMPQFVSEGLELASFPTSPTSDVVDLALGAADSSGSGRSAYVTWFHPETKDVEGAFADPSGTNVVGAIDLATRRAHRFGLRVHGASSGEPQGQALWLERDPLTGNRTVWAQNFLSNGAIGGPVGLGDTYCEGGLNSTGARAVVRAEGSAVVARDLFSLQARDLPPSQPNVFLYAPNAGFTPNPGGAAGNLCLSRPIGRGPLRTTDATGHVVERVDLAQVPAPLGSAAVLAGETWHFQGWYRDTNGSGNTTSGLRVRFL
jgi:hypothetical protein